MNLYIRIVNGKPVEHPIIEENFIQAFPDEDINNLSANFAKFTRVPQPPTGVYEEYMGVEYVADENGYTDNHIFRPFTPEEIAAKQQQMKDAWVAEEGPASWILNEETCTFEAPIPYPTDGKKYVWDEPTGSWINLD